MKLVYEAPLAQIVEVIERYCDSELNVSSGELGDSIGGGNEDLN